MPKPEAEKKPTGAKRAGGGPGERNTGERSTGERREGGQGKWLTAREGKSETDRRKAVKSERADQKQAKTKAFRPEARKRFHRARASA
ncbi:hypothetical protein QW131_01495 [Roseibium salinum]|nr:hypothetical protein [Roseibium salinum]